MAFHVTSETGRLRRVLLHRPGLEIDRMMPAMMEHLLFDDILDGDEARTEHDTFRELLERAGVETLDAGILLAEVLEEDALRHEVLDELRTSHQVGEEAVARLADLPASELAEALIAGLRDESGSERAGDAMALLPIPNYFFQRDAQTVIGDQVIICSMATEAREREPLLAATIFRHHPALESPGPIFRVHAPPHPRPEVGPAYNFPTLEGGDVIVASEEVLLVGISERTNRRGVEMLAEHLRSTSSGFRRLIAAELPARRAYMHLDTVFTFIDRGVCLAFPPVVEPDGPEAAQVYSVDLEGEELSFRVVRSLRAALSESGIEVELVPCGGGHDVLDQQREQWTDGANAFAVAPGVVLLYHRNRRTTEELARRGWTVLSEDEALATDLESAERVVVTFSGHELSRARGGPRCMTMPLEREPI